MANASINDTDISPTVAKNWSFPRTGVLMADVADRQESDEALSAVVARLRAELDGLRRAMRNRAVIEQAKGALVERMRISPDEAFDHLVRLSQHTNVKLAEVAAALVGTRVPNPGPPAAPDALDEELRGYLARQRQPATPAHRPRPPRPPAQEALQAQHQLLGARISTARTHDEIADAVADVSIGWPAPQIVVVLLLEPDGALRLVGAAGVSAGTRSQWTRIPPLPELPLVAAAQARIPVFLPDADAVREHFPVFGGMPYPSQALVALPLHDGDRVIGVLGMAWDTPLDTTPAPGRAGPALPRYLAALAEPVARRALELTGPDPADADADRGWLPLVLETMPGPVLLLNPEHDGTRVVDFRIAYANAAAHAAAENQRIELTEASLLAVLPGAGSQVLLPALTEVVQAGKTCDLTDVYVSPARDGTRGSFLIDVRGTRLWGQVLAVCDIRTGADTHAPRRPSTSTVTTADGIVLRGLCLSAEAAVRHWYDVYALPDRSCLLAVGEMAGSGVDRAATMALLRHAVPAYAVLGMAPAAILGSLNALLCQMAPEHVATMVVARFESGSRELRWAAAGQVAPVWYPRRGPAVVLSGPLGLPVGAAHGIGYDETALTLDAEDRLLLHTSGLALCRDGVLADGLEVLRRAGEETDLDDLAGLVEHVTARLPGPPGPEELCLLMAQALA